METRTYGAHVEVARCGTICADTRVKLEEITPPDASLPRPAVLYP